MSEVTYEELERTYRECSQGSAKPNLVVTNINSAIILYGEEWIKEGLADGTITMLDDLVAAIKVE